LHFVDVLKDSSTREVTFDWGIFGRAKHVVLAFFAAQWILKRQGGYSAEVAADDLFAAANE
jgi:hypothetical protein